MSQVIMILGLYVTSSNDPGTLSQVIMIPGLMSQVKMILGLCHK